MNVEQLADAINSEPMVRYSLAPAGLGGMSPPQREFHTSQARKRAFIAANKIGKSFAGAWEAWAHLLSRHSMREVPPPGSEGWLLIPDLKTGWATCSTAMRELEPRGALDPSCHYIAGIGYQYRGRKIVKVSAAYGGGFMVAKSCDASPLSLEGARVKWAWVDEPPKQSHLLALRARLTMDLAPIWFTLTPVGRPVGWLRDMLEGNNATNTDAEGGWAVQHVELNQTNAPHRTEADIAAQISECSPWEYNQRILSQWDGLTADRWVTGFSEGNIFTDDEAPERVEKVGLGWDHGERPGKSICYLVVFDGSRVWVLDEYSNDDRDTPKSEAKAVFDMLARWGVNLDGVTDARGDVNSAGRLGMGFTMNDLLERAFAELAGSSRPPFNIQTPYKKRGSVDARVRLISHACVDGKLRVHHKCARLIHTLRHWRGQNNDLKDPFDAMGYISEVYLSPALGGSSGRLIIG